jgi:glutamate/aspartate transport system substrate-binding protein
LLTAKDSGIKSFADLRGKNVVTTAGTTNERFLKSYNVDHKIDMFVISAKDHGEAFQMLQSGRAAAFYMDDALLYGERAKAHDPHKWVVVGEEQSREIYSCMVRKDDPQFLAWSTAHWGICTARGNQRHLPALVRTADSAEGFEP